MIHFYNKDRKEIMVLRNFSFDDIGEPRINFYADISYAIYKASRYISDFKVYFDKFLKELGLLYDGKIKATQLIPLERMLEIYFEQMEYGHILVTIKLNHFNMDYAMLQSMLLIKYEIDQSFLPELIEEISAVLNNGTNILK